MKKLQTEIKQGFVWVDPEKGHIIACGDATDHKFLSDFVAEIRLTDIQLILADPPYQISSDNKIALKGRKDIGLSESWDKINDDQMTDLINKTSYCARYLAPESNVWIWTSDWWVSDIKRALKRDEFKVWPTYVWVKTNPPHSIRKKCMTSACEFLVMASGKDSYFDLDAMPKQRNWFVTEPDGAKTAAIFPYWVERPLLHHSHRVKKDEKNKRGKYDPINRAQKPLDTTMHLIRAGSEKGKWVIDLFGGVGTGLVAADRTGRRCIYVENDPIQVRAAARRLIIDRENR